MLFIAAIMIIMYHIIRYSDNYTVLPYKYFITLFRYHPDRWNVEYSDDTFPAITYEGDDADYYVLPHTLYEYIRMRFAIWRHYRNKDDERCLKTSQKMLEALQREMKGIKKNESD